MHISWPLCIISSPIGKSDEKRKFYQIFQLFCIIFMLNGEFEYQIDYLSQSAVNMYNDCFLLGNVKNHLIRLANVVINGEKKYK